MKLFNYLLLKIFFKNLKIKIEKKVPCNHIWYDLHAISINNWKIVIFKCHLYYFNLNFWFTLLRRTLKFLKHNFFIWFKFTLNIIFKTGCAYLMVTFQCKIFYRFRFCTYFTYVFFFFINFLHYLFLLLNVKQWKFWKSF